MLIMTLDKICSFSDCKIYAGKIWKLTSTENQDRKVNDFEARDDKKIMKFGK
jgi:hypothetical protein